MAQAKKDLYDLIQRVAEDEIDAQGYDLWAEVKDFTRTGGGVDMYFHPVGCDLLVASVPAADVQQAKNPLDSIKGWCRDAQARMNELVLSHPGDFLGRAIG